MATVTKPKKAKRQPLHIRLREVAPGAGGSYECVILREGGGNKRDRNWYTRECLVDAHRRGLFEGLKCYLNHPTPSEEKERPERDVRYLAGSFSHARLVERDGRVELRAPVHPGRNASRRGPQSRRKLDQQPG